MFVQVWAGGLSFKVCCHFQPPRAASHFDLFVSVRIIMKDNDFPSRSLDNVAGDR